MSPKYNILNFTESFRNAERKHTILLPVVMAFVVLFSFWLVTKTRPTSAKLPEFSVGSSKNDQASEPTLTLPPKIHLNIDFDDEIGNIAIMDPSEILNPGIIIDTPPQKPIVPVARVIKANPVSKDGLPLVNHPTANGRFTKWMTPPQLNQHILALNQGQDISFWDRGHWIVAVEGRWIDNHQEFRIVYESAPKNDDYEWRYRIAQTRDVFTSNIAKYRTQGFELVQSQAYESPDKRQHYQSVWQKVDQ